ncbi:MAG TPA: Crp/Fnr family transcriptional regulator [Bacteroidales bacterium]|nr:Crp/Fnr family transcriptional regulator [Bacteroidales bacterium]
MRNECKLCAIKSKAASKLSDAEIEKLSFSCALVKFRKGDSLIRQGTFSTNIAYLRTGLAKIHIAGPYYEQIVRIVKAPSYLGLPTTFGDKINQYSVTVIEAAEVCFIDVNAFRYLLKGNSDFSYEIMLEVCRNELEVFHRCANRTQKQLRGKIADVLLELADQIYKSDNFIIPITQEDLGNLVDSSRESVSRVLNEFEKDGIISLSGKKVEIINKKSLLLISTNG